MMKIRARLITRKGATLGFLIGTKWRSRKEAVSLATENKIDGVCVRRGSHDERYLASLPSAKYRLLDIPTRVQPSNKPKLYA